MAETNSTSKEKAAEKTPDSKVVSAAKAFAVVAMVTAIPASLTALCVSEDHIINKLFYGLWAFATGYGAYVFIDGKMMPKIVEQGLPKTVGLAGLFAGLAAVGLVAWQLNAGDAEKKPVTPTQPAASLTLPKLAK